MVCQRLKLTCTLVIPGLALEQTSSTSAALRSIGILQDLQSRRLGEIGVLNWLYQLKCK